MVAVYLVLKSITCLLSILGASMIITSILRSKKNRENIQQRILAGMSVCDLVCAITHLTGPLWFPGNDKTPGLGNDMSCSVLGFVVILVQFATVLYNDSLALYYFLVIRMKICPDSKRMKRIEKYWLHSIPLAWAFLIATSAAVANGIDTWPGWSNTCGIYLSNSDNDNSANNNNNNDRDQNMGNLLYMSAILTGFFALLFNVVCLVMVYCHVRQVEKSSSQWLNNNNNSNSSSSRLTKTRLVAKQCLLYFMIIFLPWIGIAVHSLLYVTNGGVTVEWLDILKAVLAPSAGFLNGIVYFRMRYGKLRNEYPNLSRSSLVFGIVSDKLLPAAACCCCGEHSFAFEIGRKSTNEDGKDLEPSLSDDDNNDCCESNEMQMLEATAELSTTRMNDDDDDEEENVKPTVDD